MTDQTAMRTTQVVITVGAVVTAALHVIFPQVVIDSITLALVIVAIAPWLGVLLKSFELPGGFKIEFAALERAQNRAEAAGLLSEEARPEPQHAFQRIAEEDPNLALAGLRIEIEKRLSQIAESHQVTVRRPGVGSLLRVLVDNNLVTRQQQSVLADMMILLNSAVHGGKTDDRAADWALEVGPRLLASLDELVKST
jgi:hypothetical protein